MAGWIQVFASQRRVVWAVPVGAEDGVGLAVALCDALAQIGNKEAIGKLYQAMDLSHRRLRTEAAAALAKLGEEAGEHNPRIGSVPMRLLELSKSA